MGFMGGMRSLRGTGKYDNAMQISDIIGSELRSRMNEIDSQIATLADERANLVAAWGERDFAWLSEAGYIRPSLFKEWQAAVDAADEAL